MSAWAWTGLTQSGGQPLSCEHFERIVRPHLPALADTASKIASTLGADWYRLDAFVGHPKFGLRVNEVTYPSHVQDTCALRQWLATYQRIHLGSSIQLRPVLGANVFRRLSRMVGIDNETFYRQSDYVP